MPSTIGTSTTDDAVCVMSRAPFFANTRFWVFYSDGTNMVFRTSTDGSSWTNATIVRAATNGWRFSVEFDGAYVHYVYHSGGVGTGMFYRMGTPESDGTITWLAVEQTVIAGSGSLWYDGFDIACDSSGYPYISYYEGSGDDVYVIKSSTKNGTWTTAGGYPVTLKTDIGGSSCTTLVSLTSDKMYATYVRNGVPIKGKLYDGASWGSEESGSTSNIYIRWASAVADGDDVHFVFTKQTTYDILHVKRTYGVGWGSEATVQATASSTTIGTLSYDSTNDEIYCFWSESPLDDHVYYKKYSGGSWDVSPTDWIDETTDDIKNGYNIISFKQTYSLKIGVSYTTKAASPYNVRHDYLTITPPAGGNVEGMMMLLFE